MATDDLIELDRKFVLVAANERPDDTRDPYWFQHFGAALSWADLLPRRRVVLLAEQLSGKSSEFKLRHEQLRHEGHFAFFLTVVSLADVGLEGALGPKDLALLKRWQEGTAEAWFFLDSVDEARLSRKSFEQALRHFAHATFTRLGQLHLFISCRPYDWLGKTDKEAILDLLPVPKATPSTSADPSDEFLAPLFARQSVAQKKTRPSVGSNEDLLVVELQSLTDEQRERLGAREGVGDPTKFVMALNRAGLAPLASRPGDVRYLATFWRSKGGFAPYAQMMEHVVTQKATERHSHRPDNDILTLEDARMGAERIAAALTLGKLLTVPSGGASDGGQSSVQCLNVKQALPEWSDAKIGALLRRGLFIPAGYERLRFQSRWIQEYLTASWLQKRLAVGGALKDVVDLLFVESDGVPTVVPSLQPAAAWLALTEPTIRTEILARDSSVLLRHGDPGSLPIEVRRELLRRFAHQHARGELSNQHLDARELWMFADTRLGDTVREVWSSHPDPQWHFILLNIVHAARIESCVDLASTTALCSDAEDGLRIVALDILLTCNASPALEASAKELLRATATSTATLAGYFCSRLFPRHLSLQQLFYVMENANPPRAGYVEGFSSYLQVIWEKCVGESERREFLRRVTDLSLRPPFAAEHIEVSARYLDLAQGLRPIVTEAIRTGWKRWQPDIVRALMVIERASEDTPSESSRELRDLVRKLPALNHALFWADVEARRRNPQGLAEVTHYGQALLFGEPLWGFSSDDLALLYEDMRRPLAADRRIALSAIIDVLSRSGDLAAQAAKLRTLVGDDFVLGGDLNARLAPSEPTESERELRRHREANRQEREKRQHEIAQSWRVLRNRLQSDPAQLTEDAFLKSNRGIGVLKNLTVWLQRKTGEGGVEAAINGDLTEGFGGEVAAGYREALQRLWRIAKPSLPTRVGDNVSTSWKSLLALAGLGIEARTSDWAARLSDTEAVRAAGHGCLTEQGYPSWMDGLLDSRATVVAPVVLSALKTELLASHEGGTDLLHYFARRAPEISLGLHDGLYRTLTRSAPTELLRLQSALRILGKLSLLPPRQRNLYRWARGKAIRHSGKGEIEHAVHYLTLIFRLDFTRAIDHTEAWLEEVMGEERHTRAELLFSNLFGSGGPAIGGSLKGASIPDIRRLVEISHQYIHPTADARRVGSYSPTPRDRAENARGAILNALLARSGSAAYRAVLALHEIDAQWFPPRETIRLARQVAERDAELADWSPQDVIRFEHERARAIKSGAELLRAIGGVLHDIERSFSAADASSRALLQAAADETAVQHWLYEQLNLRSKRRYQMVIESEAAEGNRPDLVAASTSAPAQLAIEVKHSGKGWTFKQLVRALRRQLARDYLRPEDRRHGLMVITRHTSRTWRAPNGTPISFSELIKMLDKMAQEIVENETGPIEVRVVGLDATSPLPKARTVPAEAIRLVSGALPSR